MRELVPRAKLAEVLAELDNLVTTLYKAKEIVSLRLYKSQMANLIKELTIRGCQLDESLDKSGIYG